jgi:hypothetical protein
VTVSAMRTNSFTLVALLIQTIHRNGFGQGGRSVPTHRDAGNETFGKEMRTMMGFSAIKEFGSQRTGMITKGVRK